MVALGLTASTLVGAGGCADRAGHALCVDTEVDYATCGDLPDPGPEGPDPNDLDVRFVEVCFDGSEGCDPCAAEAITGAAVERLNGQCEVVDIQHVTLTCGPDPDPTVEDCCYKVRLEGDFSCGVEGRPLLAGAELTPRVAALQTGDAWLAGTDRFEGLRRPQDPNTVEVLRTYWLRRASYEHASVAAFARVSLQLLSLGAPAGLLRATQEAMADEVRHARLSFGLAASYGGAPPSEAGPLRIDGGVTTGMELQTALREAIFDGALGEGAATIEALEAARSCDDPVVRDVFLRIAQDEQRHALLAYQTVKWALVAHPRRAREVVRDCLREGHLRATPPAAELGAAEDDALRRHGLVASNRRAWIRHESWSGVVAPILATMLASGLRY
ncbi:ferritin-like domain-containing protein [Enhygromyxa salina]|nr:ferritin-like domain-containing protein [Enhygromyxa salina]